MNYLHSAYVSAKNYVQDHPKLSTAMTFGAATAVTLAVAAFVKNNTPFPQPLLDDYTNSSFTNICPLPLTDLPIFSKIPMGYCPLQVSELATSVTNSTLFPQTTTNDSRPLTLPTPASLTDITPPPQTTADCCPLQELQEKLKIADSSVVRIFDILNKTGHLSCDNYTPFAMKYIPKASDQDDPFCYSEYRSHLVGKNTHTSVGWNQDLEVFIKYSCASEPKTIIEWYNEYGQYPASITSPGDPFDSALHSQIFYPAIETKKLTATRTHTCELIGLNDPGYLITVEKAPCSFFYKLKDENGLCTHITKKEAITVDHVLASFEELMTRGTTSNTVGRVNKDNVYAYKFFSMTLGNYSSELSPVQRIHIPKNTPENLEQTPQEYSKELQDLTYFSTEPKALRRTVGHSLLLGGILYVTHTGITELVIPVIQYCFLHLRNSIR